MCGCDFVSAALGNGDLLVRAACEESIFLKTVTVFNGLVFFFLRPRNFCKIFVVPKTK